jgi:predicted patatin/cPLA2 family phospholipase
MLASSASDCYDPFAKRQNPSVMRVRLADESFIIAERDVARYWASDHPVLETLRSRRHLHRVNGSFPDGYRIGLAVEGGGMRGIVSGAMLCAMEDLGFAQLIDAIYGFSAGAVNAAYSLAGNCWDPLSIYYQDLPSGDFISFRKILFGKSFLNIDYLFQEIIAKSKPLDYDAVSNAAAELHVGVTNVDSLRTEDVSRFSSRADLIDTLYASSWMPISSFRTAMWRGVRAIDGAVLTGHPSRLAMNDGCTHVLSLSTRPIQPTAYRGSRLAQALGAIHLERIKVGLGAAYLRAVRDYWNDRSRMHLERVRPYNRPYVLDLAPLPCMDGISYRELNSRRLQDAARGAYMIVHSVLDDSGNGSVKDYFVYASRQMRFI